VIPAGEQAAEEAAIEHLIRKYLRLPEARVIERVLMGAIGLIADRHEHRTRMVRRETRQRRERTPHDARDPHGVRRPIEKDIGDVEPAHGVSRDGAPSLRRAARWTATWDWTCTTRRAYS